jgi:hypothetical protein
MAALAAVRAPEDYGRSFAAQAVFRRGDGFQMVRVDASAVAAEVVQVQALGDRPNTHLIHGSVRRDLPSAEVHAPVAILERALPLPTFICGTLGVAA